MKVKTFSVSLLAFCTILLLISSIATAKIIFQDNFDNSPDWQSQQTVHKSEPEGHDINFGMTRSDRCTTFCPPQGWTSYRTASSHWADDRRKDTYILSTEGARGSSGKGITYNVEVRQNWVGGSLDLWLGEAGYEELYVRYYLKFDKNWKWSNPEDTRHCIQKLIRISTFNDNIWTTSYTPQGFGSSYVNWPVFIPGWYHNASYGETTLTCSVRKAPDYYAYMDGHTNVHSPDVGDWHCYEFHVKMNSANGVADGVYQFFLDGKLKAESTTVEWKQAGSDTTHNWNWLMFTDNIFNSSAAPEDHVEMSLYMDDVVVSTEYIGPASHDPNTGQIHLNSPTF